MARALTLLTIALLALPACDDTSRGMDETPDASPDTLEACPRTGLPITPEVCDEIDNDCDGRTDEGISIEDDPQNCGGCGNVCRADNANSICVAGQCRYQCRPGFYSSTGDPANGCDEECAVTPTDEVCDESDNDCDGRVDEDFDFNVNINHCGECDNDCAFDNAEAACDGGSCRLARCDEGWGNLNGRVEDGCEARCEPANPGPEVCDDEDNDCDGVTDESFDLNADGENCGVCGNVCAYANGAGRCVDGDCELVGCEEGFSDADLDPANGCEQICVEGEDPTELCDEADNDCDGLVDEDTDKENDLENCGGCGALEERFICRAPNAVLGCEEGRCFIDQCEPGFADADGNQANGCEQPCVVSGDEVCDATDNDCDGRTDEGFDLRGDVNNCGLCGNICQSGNAEAQCVDGRCGLAGCPEGFVNADRDPTNGCEYECTPTDDPTEVCDTVDNDCDTEIDEGFDTDTDLSHCGACGEVCDPPNALPVCRAGNCELRGCEEGWFDADLEVGNGCEIECTPSDDGFEVCDTEDNDCDGAIDEDFDLQADPLNCGACGDTCSLPNGIVSCDAGECGAEGCLDGWVDADMDLENGCEYRCTPTENPAEVCDRVDNDCDGTIDNGFDLMNSLEHCGACNTPCARANAGTACEMGVCRITECEEGFADINGDPLDGCESNCIPANNGVETCNERDDDCDGRTDEETDLNNDPANCGACGRTCEIPNGEPFCNGGACDVLSCAAGFVDLDGDVENGCECRTSNGGLEICDGLDNDCNGVVDDADRVVPPEDFACLRRGVCRGVQPACRNAAWACPYPNTYEEGDETRCDEADNDCDGTIDEAFPELGGRCEVGIGACQRIGEIVCLNVNAAGCNAGAPGEPAGAELCNDEDDDCDGTVDEDSQAVVNVPAGGGVGAFTIFAYEASRPDAEGEDGGESFTRACSKGDALPWVNVDRATALQACQDAGFRLCSATEWGRACGGNGQSYPYGNNYQANTCNGQDYDTDAMTNGNQDELLPTGSLNQCRRAFDGQSIYDLSGNAWEWTSDNIRGDAYGLRGGSFGNIAGGLTCDFVLASPENTARENIGFRCCR